jgi:D-glycero-alpha-D-manno-heptose-7-phosphate kinase
MILTKTPLRVSFFGGGTDIPEFFNEYGQGAVLGTAIDKYIYHSVLPFHSEMFDYNIRIAYSDVEKVSSLDELKHTPFKEILRFMEIEHDIEISITSDLPSFSGLGSSSSFTVGLLNSLKSYNKDCYNNKLKLAYDAINIERDILKEAVGCQDQTFAAVGGFNILQFNGQNNIEIIPINISDNKFKELNNSILLFYTGIKRKAVDVESKKIASFSQKKDNLLKMRRLVDEAFNILENNKTLDEFGKLLDHTWKLKRSLEGSVSNKEIDTMYTKAIEAGALGGKLLGAGGGGYMLFYVPDSQKNNVRQALYNYYEINVKLGVDGSQVLYRE